MRLLWPDGTPVGVKCGKCWDKGWVPTGERKTVDHILTDTTPSRPCDCLSTGKDENDG